MNYKLFTALLSLLAPTFCAAQTLDQCASAIERSEWAAQEIASTKRYFEGLIASENFIDFYKQDIVDNPNLSAELKREITQHALQAYARNYKHLKSTVEDLSDKTKECQNKLDEWRKATQHRTFFKNTDFGGIANGLVCGTAAAACAWSVYFLYAQALETIHCGLPADAEAIGMALAGSAAVSLSITAADFIKNSVNYRKKLVKKVFKKAIQETLKKAELAQLEKNYEFLKTYVDAAA